MALITFSSENPDFSYLISKNPASGLLAKEMRLGKSFGWFTPPDRYDGHFPGQEYSVLFRDSDTSVSYKTHPDETFEHQNASRYSSAMFVINAISDYFQSAVKKPHEKDVVGFQHWCKINMMYIKDLKYVDIFNQHFPEFLITTLEVAHKNYHVNIAAASTQTFSQLLSFVNLFAMFNVIKNDADFFDVGEGVVTKYMECLQKLDAPYFVRYVFKVNLLRGKKNFEAYKKQLETTSLYKELKFAFGNSQLARRDQVVPMLGDLKRPIIDYGCGEGFYAQYLASRIGENPYFAIDKDPEVLEALKWRAERKGLENISCMVNHATADNLLNLPFHMSDEPIDVIAVEVIEHMPYDMALRDMMYILETMNVENLVITTPNKEFNKYYTDDESEMRHDDHHFELTQDEFVKFCGAIKDFSNDILGKRYVVSIDGIGDRVDGQSTTLMARFLRAKSEPTEKAV